MIERPILFSGPMVRALLDGNKTQTRRVMKPQPECIGDSTILQWRGGLFQPERLPSNSNLLNHCPYGQPGDRLWVRETAAEISCRLTYRADIDDGAHCVVRRWTSSIHMPREWSRILLEIVSVRVERLQDIGEADAVAEGVRPDRGGGFSVDGQDARHAAASGDRAVVAYRSLWESINGAGSWDANPWVWVVEFKRVTS